MTDRSLTAGRRGTLAPRFSWFQYASPQSFYPVAGALALQAAIDDPRRADRACAVLALVGVVNIPIIYFSVQWWNTLHQGASVSLTKAPAMAATMFAGMIVMALAFWMYSIAAALVRVRSIILERERGAVWVQGVV